MRPAEVLPQRASASPGLAGRRGPWLSTLRTRGLRRRGSPEILKRSFGFWSGRAEKFRGVGFTATSGGNRGLVEPGRRRTRVRELQVPPWRQIWGRGRGCSLTASGRLRSKRSSLPAGNGKGVLSALTSLCPSGLDSFPLGESARGFSSVTPALGNISERLSSPHPHPRNEAPWMSS